MGSYYFSNIRIYFTYIIKTPVFSIFHWSYSEPIGALGANGEFIGAAIGAPIGAA